MRRTAILLASAAVGALMLAALDDLTTGHEPGHGLEWLMVGAGSLWFSGLLMARSRRTPS